MYQGLPVNELSAILLFKNLILHRFIRFLVPTAAAANYPMLNSLT
jgi:hypothetical protein